MPKGRDPSRSTCADEDAGDVVAPSAATPSVPPDPFERLAALAEPWCEDDLVAVLGAVAADHGLTHAAAFSMPSTDESGAATRYLFGNWPDAFSKAYEQHGLHRFKLVIGALRTDPMPFSWDIDTLHGADEPDPPPAARMLDAAGYRAGVLLPVHGMTAMDGVISLAGPAYGVTRAQERRLHLFAMAFFGVLATARFETNRVNNPLSQRERDCLRLAMLGKTSSEAGIILDLSEYTISQYFTAAQRKLGAANRTHAVAIAAQNGYLS